MDEIKNFINPNSIPNYACSSQEPDQWKKCTSEKFVQQFRLKKVSKFQSGNGQEGFIAVPIFVCAACGKIVDLK